MSGSAQAHLVFGYRLGNGDSGWLVREAAKYQMPDVPWYREGDGGDEEFIDQAENLLRPRLGKAVKFLAYGHYNIEHYLLAASDSVRDTLDWGDTLTVTANDIDTPAAWTMLLEEATQILGLTPHEWRPAWHICASYH